MNVGPGVDGEEGAAPRRIPWRRALVLVLPGTLVGVLLTLGALVWFITVLSYLLDLGSHLTPVGTPAEVSGQIAENLGRVIRTDPFALLVPVLVGLGLGVLLVAAVPVARRQRSILVALGNLVAALAPPLTLGLHLWWPGG